MVTCLTDAQWEEYLEGDLDGPDEELDAHLQSCPTCPLIVRRLQDRLLRGEGPPTLPSGVGRQLDDLWRRRVPAGGPPIVPGYTNLVYFARGGLSVVYRAVDSGGRHVAIKFLERGLFATEIEIKEFLAEAERLQAVAGQVRADGRRSGLIDVLESGQSVGRGPYIVMELAAGGSLHERVRSTPLPPEQAARVLARVAETVEELHVAGLLHRDLKPSNILLQPSPKAPLGVDPRLADLAVLEPLVSDLGMARCFDPSTGAASTAGLKGTPEYMAPELLRGKPPSRQSDVYALGATFYELLTGRPPFRSSSTPDLLAEIRRGHPTRPRRHNKQLPRALEAICVRCLERNPRRRYATARELAEDLQRYLDGGRVKATLPWAHRRTWRWVMKNPLSSAVFVVLMFVAIAASGWAVAKDRQSQLDLTRAQAAEAAKTQADEVIAANLQTSNEARLREVAQKKATHEATVWAARAAARRGDWSSALQYYQIAVHDQLPGDVPFPDQLQLRVERLFGFFAVNDEARLKAELEDLRAQPTLGRLAAKVSLVRGAYLLCDSTRRAEGLAAVREALVAREDLLYPGGDQSNMADLAFAEALVETRPIAVVDRLRQAIRHDPLHYPAESSLVVALLTSGQPEEAERRAERMEEFFPASPVPPLVRAVVAVMRGDRKAMRAGVAKVAERLHADLSDFLHYCEILTDVLDILAKDTPTGNLDILDQLKIVKLSLEMQSIVETAAKPLAFAVPTVGLAFAWFNKLLAAFKHDAGKGDNATFELFMGMSQDSPEAFILALAAANRLVAACALVNANQLAEYRAALAQLSDLAYRAADSPTMLVRSPIRYQTRLIGMIADLGLLKLDPEPKKSEVRIRRVRDNLHRMVADGRRWPVARRECMTLFTMMLTSSLTPELAADWKLDRPEGVAAFQKRNRDLTRLGRTLLEDWVDDEPKSRAARKLLTDLNAWEAAGYRSGPAPIPLAIQ